MSQRSRFLNFAKSQVGIIGGDIVRQWYNENISNIGNYKWPWCAAGISYCAGKTNIESNIISPTASSSVMMNNFIKINCFKNKGEYTPIGGDIVIFKWASATTQASHVGIVDYVRDNYVHTIEFNSGSNSDGAVAKWKYPLTSSSIVGYCIPNFKESKATLVKNGYIRSNPWLDPKYNSSKKLVKLSKGDKVTFVKDDLYGWSKVKYGNTSGYIQNSKLAITDISKFPYVKLNKTLTLKEVRSKDKKKFAKSKRVKFICTIEKGKLKGVSIIRYKGIIYYVKNKYLYSFEKR